MRALCCDGVMHPHACEAQGLGVDVSGLGGCTLEP